MTHTTTLPKHRQPWLGSILLLDAAGLGWAALVIFRISTGSGRAILFGLSAPSLLLVGLTLLAALGFLAAGLLTFRENSSIFNILDWLQKRPARSIGSLTVTSLAGWLIAWTPAESFATGYYYALRLLPIAGWLSFASGTLALFLLAVQRGASFSHFPAYFRQNRAVLIAGAVALCLMLGVAWLAATRILQIAPEEEDYWYGAGVPVLAWQVLAAIMLGLAAAWAEKKYLQPRQSATRATLQVDLILFVVIWVSAGILWARIPPTSSFMISEPYPPNFEYYPAGDGQNYDISSQFALIGQKLFNGGEFPIYFERPLYSAFLLYLHLLAGQNFSLALAIQAALFAVFPALAYLLGKTLHSRAVGVTLAAILTWRGANGLIAGGILENSNQKMFLSDFPTAIGLALMILLAIWWARHPQREWRLAGWISGCIGLWGLVRPHMVVFLPIAGLVALVLYFRKKRSLVAIAGFMLAAYLATVMPWVQFNGREISLIDVYLGRIRAIISERYPDLLLPKPSGSLAPRQIASLDAFGLNFAPPFQKSVSEFALDHLLNNLAMSALSLPATFRNVDLTITIKQSETYWKPYWDGTLSPSARFFLPINLLLLALGLGLAWKRFRAIGLFPLFGMLIYTLINSLARTSGGRYLVPTDWVFILYYILGLVVIFELIAAWLNHQFAATEFPAQPGPTNRRQPIWQGIAVIAILGGLGSSIPLAGFLHPQRYQPLNKNQVAAIVMQKYPDQLGISPAEMQTFLEQPASVVMEGRALYPRFIWRGINPFIPSYLLQAKLYSRMSFVAIGPQGNLAFVLPSSDEWFPLPQASDVIILGCLTDESVAGWAVIAEETNNIYLRHPAAKLTCPLPEPICNNNGGCR